MYTVTIMPNCILQTNHLVPIGGRDAADAVRRTMRQMIANDLACKYSWFGRRQKLPFSTLALAFLLQSEYLP